jgi:hypothetical protein
LLSAAGGTAAGIATGTWVPPCCEDDEEERRGRGRGRGRDGVTVEQCGVGWAEKEGRARSGAKLVVRHRHSSLCYFFSSCCNFGSVKYLLSSSAPAVTLHQ